MAYHRFQRVYRHRISMIAQHLFNRIRFANIVLGSRATMSVNMVYIPGLDAGILKSQPNAVGETSPLFWKIGHVISIAVGRVSGDFTVDRGVSRLRVAPFLQEQDRGSLAQHALISPMIKWAGGRLRVLGVFGKCTNYIEGGKHYWSNWSFRRAGYRYIDFP